jgi:cardiolipin synthase A/B
MDMLWILLDVISIFAIVTLALLGFLLLFEPGLAYRLSAPVHGLADDEKVRLLTEQLGGHLRVSDQAQVFSTGAEYYGAQLRAIAAARITVHLEAYIFHPGAVADRFIAALCERAAAGVRIRVVVDALGSRGLRRDVRQRLRAAGVEIYRYHAFRWYTIRRLNNRTHRNLLIVDASTAFLGGSGIADYWLRDDPPPWRDTVVCVTGELVRGLQTVFAENWLECTGELLTSSDSFPQPLAQLSTSASLDGGAVGATIARGVRGLTVGSTPTSGRSNQARVLIQYLLAAASDRILICSPYFIPDGGIRQELIGARARGVSVEIITGGPHTDHRLVRRAGRKRFGPLLRAGVRIYEYQPRMLHAKILLIDGKWSVVGSTNFDHRSFGLNDEVNALLLGAEVTATLTRDFEADRRDSRSFSYEDWLHRSWGERLLAWLGTIIERHQ